MIAFHSQHHFWKKTTAPSQVSATPPPSVVTLSGMDSHEMIIKTPHIGDGHPEQGICLYRNPYYWGWWPFPNKREFRCYLQCKTKPIWPFVLRCHITRSTVPPSKKGYTWWKPSNVTFLVRNMSLQETESPRQENDNGPSKTRPYQVAIFVFKTTYGPDIESSTILSQISRPPL